MGEQNKKPIKSKSLTKTLDPTAKKANNGKKPRGNYLLYDELIKHIYWNSIVPGGFWVTTCNKISISTPQYQSITERKKPTVVNNPTNPLDLIHDPPRHLPQKFTVKIKPVRRHIVGGLDGSQGNDLIMHPFVTHNTNSSHR